jgi:hypothetical protein
MNKVKILDKLHTQVSTIKIAAWSGIKKQTVLTLNERKKRLRNLLLVKYQVKKK